MLVQDTGLDTETMVPLTDHSSAQILKYFWPSKTMLSVKNGRNW